MSATDTIKQLRERLQELSEQFWEKYLKALPADPGEEDPDAEGFAVLEGVDPTLQTDYLHDERHVLYRDPDKQLHAIRMNESYNELVKLLRQTQSDFGWDQRDNRWDVVGLIVDRRPFYDQYLDQMDQKLRSKDVFQEQHAQASAFVRSFDEAGDICCSKAGPFMGYYAQAGA